MRRPNFFIVGAPKCGTTSLATWLGRHPSVFIPHVKEPHHFNTDDAPLFASRSSYERLFRAASDQHLAIGEASASYLYSNDAVPNIEAAYPGSRFIVLLRNPVEMAPAWHAQLLLSGVGETERDFATAWALQEARRQGRNVPSVTLNPRWLLYGDVCGTGAQLARLYERAGEQRVLALLLDDLRRDAGGVYRQTLRFLGLPDDGRQDFPVMNASRRTLIPYFDRLGWLLSRVKRGLGIEHSFGLLNRIDYALSVPQSREPLCPRLRQELADYFADDIALLARLIGRDLSHWLA